MSPRDWLFRIQDIIDAVIRNLEIIGEAGKHVPDDLLNRYSEIPWEQMSAMRNLLIHEYFGVDIEIIWKTVVEDLPILKRQLVGINWEKLLVFKLSNVGWAPPTNHRNTLPTIWWAVPTLHLRIRG